MVVAASPLECHDELTPVLAKPSVVMQWMGLDANSDDSVLLAKTLIPSLRFYWRTFKQVKPDVAVLRGMTQPYILLAIPLLILFRVRIVLYTQGAVFRKKVRFGHRVLGNLLRLTGVPWFSPVLARGNTCIKDMQRVPGLEFVPFIKRFSCNESPVPRSDSPPRILAVGKYEPRKNLLLLLEALSSLKDKFDFHLTWAGDCSSESHRAYRDQALALIKDYSLESRVSLLVNVVHSDVDVLYRNADLFILPSESEPASYSQVEAMANGLAVICSSDNGTANYVIDGENGFVIEISPDRLANRISWYLSDPTRLFEHGLNSRKRMSEGAFSSQIAFQKFVRIVSPRMRT
ncbi:MAG: hypothetical protein Aurels2KO_27160 [Aureliella sp.]